MPTDVRGAWLREACGRDEALRQEVESLLAHEQSAERILDSLAGAAAAAVTSDRSASLVGARIGAYEILSRLGEGGMGEVYRARDTQLERDVAIKVLPPAFTGDRDRLARFEREARVLAALNHPNIGAIYGIEPVAESRALILELVEGETLASRIAQGAGRRGIPIAEALRIAEQIAEALEAAHDQGIVHRDLKPTNVKITPSGTVKVLDFGLAKVGGATGRPVADLANSPTFTVSGTHVGMVLGTAAYMSPEQAAGKSVDKRGDLWSFGVVLLEMLTGRQVFTGETVSHVLASVLTSEPDWAALPAGTPPSVRRLLRRCLEKDPRRRLDSAAAARLELEEDSSSTSIDETPGTRPRRLWSALIAGGVLLVIALTGFAYWRPRGLSPIASATTIRTTLSLPPSTMLNHDGGIAISPDGQTLAFVARSQEGSLLYVRRLDEWEPRAIPGTDRATNPFFSPDGRWIAFGREGRGVIEKIPVRGGPPQLICEVDGMFQLYGAIWEPDGTITFASWPQVALQRVSADGGTPETLKRSSDGIGTWYLWPERLPGNRGVLFTVLRQGQTSIAVLAPGALEPRTIVHSGGYPRYLSTGHLLYVSQGQIMAVPFDLQRLEIRGGTTTVVDDVTENMLSADYDISSDGTLVYVPSGSSLDRLVWKDRHGTTTPLALNPRRYDEPLLSPDGRRLSVAVFEGPARNVWIGSVEREPLTRVTSGNDDWFGLWTPDSRRLVLSSGRDGRYNLFMMILDGTGKIERLTNTPHGQIATSISPDGDHVLLNQGDESGVGARVWDLSISSKESRPLMKTQSGMAVFSPDGRWVAYQSNESGGREVYVRPYPGPGSSTQVSVGGGSEPRWNPNGRELFYMSPSAVMSVPVLDTKAFRAGAPVALFAHNREDYVPTPDGQRFLTMEKAEKGPSQLKLVQHWFEDLKARVPTK